ncbi:ribosome maturation factor RimM [Pistricoccus aurantiacus]|uniref:ribosome maturation factor RimM n=1 Tax=Pistricoccus aurantiacus TaxID=1883414 RepID=UPI00364301D6
MQPDSDSPEQKSDQYVVLGQLTSPHGVKGWIKVYSYTSPMDGIFDYPEWRLQNADGQQSSYRLSQGRRQGRALVASLEGITSREQAEQLTGADILLPKSALPRLEADEYYWYQLEGLQVVTSHGVSLGCVDHLFETGANDVLVVKGEDRQRLLPYLPDQVVIAVDLAAGRMTVDWDPEF